MSIWDIVTDLHDDAATADLLSALYTLRVSGLLVARSAPEWRTMGIEPRATGLPGRLFLATLSQYTAWNAVYTVLLVRDDESDPFRSMHIWRHDNASTAPGDWTGSLAEGGTHYLWTGTAASDEQAVQRAFAAAENV